MSRNLRKILLFFFFLHVVYSREHYNVSIVDVVDTSDIIISKSSSPRRVYVTVSAEVSSTQNETSPIVEDSEPIAQRVPKSPAGEEEKNVESISPREDEQWLLKVVSKTDEPKEDKKKKKRNNKSSATSVTRNMGLLSVCLLALARY